MYGAGESYSTLDVIRFLFPRIPPVIKSALWHCLGLSPTSHKWDMRTDMVMAFMRNLSLEEPRVSVSRLQEISRGSVIKGSMWISKVTMPTPEEDDVRTTFVKVIDDLNEGGETYTIPDLAPVEAEWTGYRANADPERPRPDLSEAHHYEKLMAEVSSNVTILYFHGGAFYLCDPSTHRASVADLARLCRGRCLSVRYRLAPKYAFPCGLLDAFLAYLSLLCPPPDSFHDPVPASQIVLAGDSAGGALALSLVQIILHIQRSSSSTVRFHNQTISVPLPAGVATHSSWMDLSRCMPCLNVRALYDYLPPPRNHGAVGDFPACEIWPTSPVRGDIYCDTSMLCHPLVSVLAAQDWRGSCPLWFGYGQEMMLDEGRAVARRAARQGVSVVWDEWEAMPHCFAQLLQHLPASKKLNAQWTGFCEQVVGTGGAGSIGSGVQTKGTWHAAKTGEEKPVDLMSVEGFSDVEIMQMMKAARAKRPLANSTAENIPPKL